MSESWLEFLQTPERRKSLFYLSQVVLGAIAVGYFFFFRKNDVSAFGAREADLRKRRGPGRPGAPVPGAHVNDELAQSKRKRQADPLLLEGIQIEGRAHEILGVSREAKPEQIQKAYRDRMKRYHPDKVGRPGSREWTDAQKIAAALSRAKEEMLEAFKKR